MDIQIQGVRDAPAALSFFPCSANVMSGIDAGFALVTNEAALSVHLIFLRTKFLVDCVVVQHIALVATTAQNPPPRPDPTLPGPARSVQAAVPTPPQRSTRAPQKYQSPTFFQGAPQGGGQGGGGGQKRTRNLVRDRTSALYGNTSTMRCCLCCCRVLT